MALATPRLRREFKTMQRMVEIYCRDHCAAAHGTGIRCPDCEAFLDYAGQRLAKCPYGEAKPVCARCPIHCYKNQRRDQARRIMRHAGPRMTLSHPWLALMHVVDRFRRVRHPMEMRGSKRRFSSTPRA